MRMAAAGALAVLAFAAPAHARPQALIVFLPRGPGETRPLLDEFAARGMAIGMTSPTVGGFKPRQMGLDMSQGARIPTRLYSKRIGALVPRDGRLVGWDVALRRAQKAPGDLKPGLLAGTVEQAGGRVGFRGGSIAPVVAADRAGRVRPASAADALSVVTVAPGAAGLRGLDALLAAHRGDFIYVVEAPYGRKTRLLPSGISAPGIHGQLRSVTTRRDGLIAATDVAPSVLRFLHLQVPAAMQGEPIEGRGNADAAAVLRTAGRLSVVTSRRAPALLWLLCSWLVLLVVLRVAGGVAGGRAGVRIGLLAGLWMPGVALLTAALEPSRTAEAAILSLGSLALGALTDRLVRWPGGPALPALVVFAAHAIDLVRGSPLIGASIAGPNPEGGARFFGIGNELEVWLSVAVLIGVGAALSTRPAAERRAPLAFASAAVVAGLIMGAGRLGADVGAVVTLGAGGAAAVIASLPTGPSRRALALGIAAPVMAIGALIVVDLVTSGNGHLTRSVLHAHGSESLGDVVRRRLSGSFSSLSKPGWTVAFVLALAMMVWLAAYGRAVLKRIPKPFAAALIGSWVAVVVGTLANDSGPLVLVIGAVLLMLAWAYAAIGPEIVARPLE